MIVAGLATAAVVSLLVYYVASSKQSALARKKKKLDDDDDDGHVAKAGGKNRSIDFKDIETSSDSTPKKSNESSTKARTSPSAAEEKEIHLTIEALDKKGKAFFKNKQVRLGLVMLAICFGGHIVAVK